MTFAAFADTVESAKPTLAFVLGSGMGDVPAAFDEISHIAFSDVPGLLEAGTSSLIPGHASQIALGICADRPILLFRGRLHFYEGHPWERVGKPIALAAQWGVRTVVLTNAAGGIRDDLNPGDLMVLGGHLAWLSPRETTTSIPESEPYSPRIIRRIQEADAGVRAGIYGGVTGPCYETPAEIRALRAAGADAVGMSTVHEARTAHALGMEVGALSLITNKAAGLSGMPLNHREVLETAKAQTARLSKLIEGLCVRL